MRILAVDPGDKRLGIAISDPSGTIANPLTILKHISRKENAITICNLARQYNAGRIVIGLALGVDNQATPQSLKAERLAQVIRESCEIEVVLWDETSSTAAAIEAQRQIKGSRRKKGKPVDDLAATYILQTYLEWLRSKTPQDEDPPQNPLM